MGHLWIPGSEPFREVTSQQTIKTECWVKDVLEGLPGDAVVESPPADAGDTGSCPSLGRSHMPRSG